MAACKCRVCVDLVAFAARKSPNVDEILRMIAGVQALTLDTSTTTADSDSEMACSCGIAYPFERFVGRYVPSLHANGAEHAEHAEDLDSKKTCSGGIAPPFERFVGHYVPSLHVKCAEHVADHLREVEHDQASTTDAESTTTCSVYESDGSGSQSVAPPRRRRPKRAPCPKKTISSKCRRTKALDTLPEYPRRRAEMPRRLRVALSHWPLPTGYRLEGDYLCLGENSRVECRTTAEKIHHVLQAHQFSSECRRSKAPDYKPVDPRHINRQRKLPRQLRVALSHWPLPNGWRFAGDHLHAGNRGRIPCRSTAEKIRLLVDVDWISRIYRGRPS